MDVTYHLEELTTEEAAALTKDLQEVLKKHNCEMGVTSSINMMKRVDDAPNEEIPSPYVKNGDTTTEETNTTPEESGESVSG